MPASFCSAAGTIFAWTPVSSGTHLSDSLLIPPPTMIRSGDISASMCWRYSDTRTVHSFQLQPCSTLPCSETRFSASLLRISMCPNSVFRTSTPSVNSADPTPVPKVSISTDPFTPTPAPNFISAIPAASASLSTATSVPIALPNSPAASVPIHDLSTFAAERMVPPITIPGKVAPVTPVHPNACATSLTTSVTASGVAGCGVAIFFRSAASFPVSRSTGAPLIPVPPMSIPNARICLIPSRRGSPRSRPGFP
ncbi:MAG: hypothetical protein QOH87_1476 [Trebonia sp.]|nr:hypothetical protein [Trebonia sp.]